jgi:hypothetical protein
MEDMAERIGFLSIKIPKNDELSLKVPKMTNVTEKY